MNEIEKLYENAGVEKQYYSFKSSCGKTYNWELNENGNDKYNMCFIGKPEIKERSFTAEKQLELIKWLASSRKGILISDFGENEFNISTGFYYCAKHIQNFKSNKDLDIVIAMFINSLWQDLTEEEKEQIRRILEC